MEQLPHGAKVVVTTLTGQEIKGVVHRHDVHDQAVFVREANGYIGAWMQDLVTLDRNVHEGVELDEDERATRLLISNYRRVRGTMIDGADIAVLNVFKALWWSALTVERIEVIAMALNNLTSEFRAQPALTRLVRAKVLRKSAKKALGGKALYEVNF
jgi:hypothetical protein